MNTPAFHERHSLAIRLWRITTTSTFALLVSTALLSKAVFGSDYISWIIEKFNLQKGIALSPEQLALQLLNLRESILAIHVAMGYLFTLLLVAGVMVSLIFTGSKDIKPKAIRMVGILAFAGTMGTMAATGIWMSLNNDMEIFSPAQFNSMKSIHETAYHALLTTSLMYTGGKLLWNEKKTMRNIAGKFMARMLAMKRIAG